MQIQSEVLTACLFSSQTAGCRITTCGVATCNTQTCPLSGYVDMWIQNTLENLRSKVKQYIAIHV